MLTIRTIDIFTIIRRSLNREQYSYNLSTNNISDLVITFTTTFSDSRFSLLTNFLPNLQLLFTKFSDLQF